MIKYKSPRSYPSFQWGGEGERRRRGGGRDREHTREHQKLKPSTK